MKIGFGIAILLLSMGFTACAHDSKDSGTAAVGPSPGDSCSAVSQIICTREYVPTNCALGTQTFAGSNPCEARKLAKAYACEKKTAVVDADIKCESKNKSETTQNIEAGATAGEDQCGGGAERKPCTREYRPQVCRLGAVSAKGSNLCEALNALKTSVCSKKVAFHESQTACEAVDGGPVPTPMPKAKRSQ